MFPNDDLKACKYWRNLQQIQPTDHGYNPHDFGPHHHGYSSSSYPTFPEITVHRHSVHNLDSIYEWRKKLKLLYRLDDDDETSEQIQNYLRLTLFDTELNFNIVKSRDYPVQCVQNSTCASRCECVACLPYEKRERARQGNMALRRWQSPRSPDVFTRLRCAHTGGEMNVPNE